MSKKSAKMKNKQKYKAVRLKFEGKHSGSVDRHTLKNPLFALSNTQSSSLPFKIEMGDKKTITFTPAPQYGSPNQFDFEIYAILLRKVKNYYEKTGNLTERKFEINVKEILDYLGMDNKKQRNRDLIYSGIVRLKTTNIEIKDKGARRGVNYLDEFDFHKGKITIWPSDFVIREVIAKKIVALPNQYYNEPVVKKRNWLRNSLFKVCMSWCGKDRFSSQINTEENEEVFFKLVTQGEMNIRNFRFRVKDFSQNLKIYPYIVTAEEVGVWKYRYTIYNPSVVWDEKEGVDFLKKNYDNLRINSLFYILATYFKSEELAKNFLENYYKYYQKESLKKIKS